MQSCLPGLNFMAVGRLRPLFSLSHASPICPNSALPRKPCCSSGEVVATGSFQTADVVTSGISTVYLSGVSQAVNLELGGVTDLYLQPASDSVQITGRWAWGRMWLQWEAAVAEHPEPTTHCHGAVSSPNHPVPAHLSASPAPPPTRAVLRESAPSATARASATCRAPSCSPRPASRPTASPCKCPPPHGPRASALLAPSPALWASAAASLPVLPPAPLC